MTDDKAAERPDSGQPRLVADERANVTIVDGDGAFASSDVEKDAAQRFFGVELGPCIMPCWTERIVDGDVQIRLWTGYSWLEFGSGEHLPPNSVKRLSDGLDEPE